MNRILRIIALLGAITVALVAVFGGKLRAFQHEHGAAQAQPTERKVLYWYDAMNPQHHYDKPGKAPDGMDLVPMYAEPGSSGGAIGKSERKVLYWYDPMHPQYKSDKPGKSPDCGMDMVPKYAEDLPAAAGAVNIAADRQQLMGVRTAVVQRQRLTREIHTSGQFVADETRLAHVHVKVAGYIEKVFADFPGQSVRKGQPLFTVYSPDLVATQQEYLIAKRGERSLANSDFPSVSQGAQSLLASARERLKLWDVTDAQIEKLDRTGEVSRTLTIYSPVSGVIQERKAFPNTAVNPDMDLYAVADLSQLWVNADIYEYEAPYVRVGQPAEVRLSYFPGKVWRGRISFIYPSMDPQTRTLKVRIDLPNAGLQLKPQMFADVTVNVDYGDNVVVPEEAILDSGREQTVFVADGGGRFIPRKVTLGARVDGKAVVLSGLKAGETIVTSGNFLIDSESQLRSATEGMQR